MGTIIDKLRWAPLVGSLLLVSLLSSCDNHSARSLPIIGEISEPFSFINQDNQTVTQELVAGKISIVDFFFTSCPSICPIMKRQMVRVYEAFQDEPAVVLVSHSIDPEHDTVEVLHAYAAGLGITTSTWHLVTGDQDEIFAMAKHYMLAAMKYDEAPGGYLHSGSFVLVDDERRIRGYYDGTDSEAVDRLIEDVKILLAAR